MVLPLGCAHGDWIQRRPITLRDSFRVLKKTMGPKQVEAFRSMPFGDVVLLHHGFGAGLRSHWRLWSGRSAIALHMRMRGFVHADDMSSAISRSFWLHLNGHPLRVRQQARYYRGYWRSYRVMDRDARVRAFVYVAAEL